MSETPPDASDTLAADSEEGRSRGSVVLIAARLAALAIQVITLPIVVRAVGDTGFGAASTAQVIATFAMLLDFGFGEGGWTSLLRAGTDPSGREIVRMRRTHMLLWLSVGMSGLVVVTLLGLVIPLSDYKGASFPIFAAAGFYFLWWSMHMATGHFFMALKRFSQLALVNSCSTILGQIISLAMTFTTRRPEWILLGPAVGCIVSTSIGMVVARQIRRKLEITPRFDRELAKSFFRIGVKSYFNRCLTYIMGGADRIIVGLVSQTQLGIYEKTTRVTNGLHDATTQIRNTLYADITRSHMTDPQKFARDLDRLSRMSLMIAFTFIVIPSAFGTSILHILFKEGAYSGGTILMLCRATYCAFEQYYAIFAIGILAMIKPHLHLRVTIWNAGVTVLATYPMFQAFGVLGVGYMNVGLNMLLLIPYLIMVKRRVSTEFPIRAHFRAVLTLFAVAGVMVAVCILVSAWLVNMHLAWLSIAVAPLLMGVGLLAFLATGQVAAPSPLMRVLNRRMPAFARRVMP